LQKEKFCKLQARRMADFATHDCGLAPPLSSGRRNSRVLTETRNRRGIPWQT
jgi:hypothetical protein